MRGGGGGALAPFPYPLCQTIDQLLYISHPPPVKASSCTIDRPVVEVAMGTYQVSSIYFLV